MCYLGCKDICVDKCMAGNYESSTPANYCDSGLCQWAMNTKGHANSSYEMTHGSFESDVPLPSVILAPRTSLRFNRNKNNVLIHDSNRHDSFGFFSHPHDADYFVGDGENLDNTHPDPLPASDSNELMLITNTEPKLDFNQISAGLHLSPEDIQEIMTGLAATPNHF